MKKLFIRNFIFIFLFISFLVGVCTIAYGYISNKVLKDNVGDNLTSIINSSTYSLTQQFEGDYVTLSSKITSVTEGITDTNSLTLINKKLEILEANKEKILFPENIRSGFGALIKKDNGKFCYLINGVEYYDKNNTFTDIETHEDIVIFNFGIEAKVGINQKNEFSDIPYVIFKFGDIIVYANANQYLLKLIDESKTISFENIYLALSDGKILYQTKGLRELSIYDSLRANGNDQAQVGRVSDLLNGLNKNSYATGIKYNGYKCYALSLPILSDEFSTNINLVEFVTYQRSTRPINQALVPLVASFTIIVIAVSIAQIASYIVLSRKSNDINTMVYRRYNEPIYQFKINRIGKILSMNKNFKEILTDYKNYLSIKDFNFKEQYSDYIIAAITQKPLTIHLSKEDTKTHDEAYLRCIVLRHYSSFIVSCINATAEEKQNENFVSLALYDPVTKLPNKEVFKFDISTFINQIEHKKNEGLISLMMIKIKNFNNFQSFYGKLIGDEIKQEIKNILINNIDQRQNKLYYVSNSTFAIAMEGMSSYDEAIEMTKFITELFKKPIVIDSNTLQMDLIFGIYNLDLETFTNTSEVAIFNGLVKLLEKVIASPTKNYGVYDLSIERYISSEEVLEQDIRKAIENREFEMYMQPQFNTDDDRIGGFEMLIRWNNPKYYRQSPQHFIEVAEQNGLIIQISKFINDETMRIAKQLEKYNLEFSINVSPVQLLQAGFVNEILDVAEKYKVDKTKIALEITETFLMENFSLMNEKLKVLQKAGFKIHLDDFCTGYSSMLYLRELPVDAIKIDKEFTKYINTDSYSRVIVNKLTSLAKSLNLDIIAEGVEDSKQVAFLTKNGCNILQGYIVSKAVPLEQAIKLIEGYNVTKTMKLLPDKKGAAHKK